MDTSIRVVAEAELVRNTAAYGSTLQNTQISELPINGRNWQNLMTVVPGAVDTGAGNGASVRFFARGGDDNNFRIDGVDATTVRNQTDSKSRLMISEDAIAEFRVNSALYTAESGGAPGGQVDIDDPGGSARRVRPASTSASRRTAPTPSRQTRTFPSAQATPTRRRAAFSTSCI